MMITSNDFNALKDMVAYLEKVPYDVTRNALYSAEELYKGYNPDDETSFETCYDTLTYHHFMHTGKHGSDALESLARALHDHGIHVALDNFFNAFNGNKCIGLMGGHALLRTDKMFRKVVLLCKRLTEAGFLMLSGGGPGAMEATHLGAWMAGRTIEDVDDALQMMMSAPSFRDKGWLASAFAVRNKYPQSKYVSLGIPTWLYGHEPSTPFASHIAKFFENSIREDSILTLAFGGIVYTPGSAGTLQEIFQDAVQNHYKSFGFASPMVFMGKRFWTEEIPVYPFMQEMMQTGRYKNLLLTITDDQEEILETLSNFKPAE
ncbi:MAG: hypothetical protein K6A32_04115 [Bacteroidales bacterium]|nr:hypothetical protein [Bacteroidales bacterium]